MGTRESSNGASLSVTGIQDNDVKRASVAKRMSWAWKRETTRREGMTVVGLMLFIDITILSPICFQSVSPPSPTHHQVKTQKHNLTYSRQAVSAPRRYIREPTPTVLQPGNFLLLRRRGSARPICLWHYSCQIETDSAAAYLRSRSSGMGLQPSALPANV
jgi:hypothetical protein